MKRLHRQGYIHIQLTPNETQPPLPSAPSSADARRTRTQPHTTAPYVINYSLSSMSRIVSGAAVVCKTLWSLDSQRRESCETAEKRISNGSKAHTVHNAERNARRDA